MPVGHAGVGRDGHGDRAAGRGDADLARRPRRPSRRRVVRVDAQRERPANARQHRRFADHASVVVEPPTHHEAQSVRVARGHVDVRHAAVPGAQLGLRRRSVATLRGSVAATLASASGRSVAASPSTLIGSHEVPEPSSARIDSARVRSTSSSRCSLNGSTTPSRARRSSAASTPAERGRDAASSSVTSSTVARSKSAPSRSASSPAMRQSSIAVPSGATLRPTRCTRPSRLVTLPVFSPHSVQGSTTSARSDVPVRNAPTAMIFFAPAIPRRGEIGVGEVGDGIGAEDHQHLDLAGGARLRGSLRVEPRAPGHATPHADSNHSRPASSDTRPGRKPGARPESIAPCTLPRRSAERNRTSGTSRSAGAGAHRDRARLRERRAAEHHDDRTGTLAARPCRCARARRRRAPRPATIATTSGRVLGEPVRDRGEVDERHTQLHRGAADAQVEHRQLLFEIGTEQHDRRRRDRSRRSRRAARRARPRPAARRRSARRRCRCRSRPSSSAANA